MDSIPHSVDRRTALRLAAGAALAVPGCSEGSKEEPAESKQAEQQKPDKSQPLQSTRRLFTIHIEGSTKWEERAPINDKWHELSQEIRQRGDVLGHWSATPDNVKPQFVAWLKPTTAAELRKLNGVRKVEAHNPGEPVKSTIGPLRQQLTEPPVDGKRNLIVVLGPNSWSNSIEVKGFETTEDVAGTLKEKLKSNDSISVEAIKAATWDVINKAGVHIGPQPGQIRVTVEGNSISNEVLKILQSHPQVEKLQWDHAEVIYKCPPCGMG